MIALPSRSLTEAISPTSTPAMLTVCPWPGVTAWAVDISASTSKKSLPTTGTQAGRASRCLPRITLPTTAATPGGGGEPLLAEDHAADDRGHQHQAEDRQEVRQVLADRRSHFAFSGAGRRLAPNGLSLARTASRSASRRSLSRTDLTCAVLAPVGADF